MFEKLKKSIRLKWMQLKVAAGRELYKKDPLQRLLFCTEMILNNPDFELNPTIRHQVIYAPQRAKLFTELMSEITDAIENDKKASTVFKLGPFREQTPIVFLSTETGCIDKGNDHVLFHIAAIRAIVIYIKTGQQENLTYSRYNLRVLEPVVPDFQLYVDSIFELYKVN